MSFYCFCLPAVMNLAQSCCYDGPQCPHLQHRDNIASYPIVGIVRECLKRCHIPRSLQRLHPMWHVVSGDSFLFLHFLLAFQRPSELNQRQFCCMAILYEALSHCGVFHSSNGEQVLLIQCFRWRSWGSVVLLAWSHPVTKLQSWSVH